MERDAVDELEACLDRLVAQDPAGLAGAELHAQTVRLCQLRSRLEAACTARVGAWDRSREWASDGSRSAAARLARETGLSPQSCGRLVSRARRLVTMPATTAALGAGDISVDMADLLGRANRGRRRPLFARDETDLVAHCQKLVYREAERALFWWTAAADDETQPDDDHTKADDDRAQRHFDADRTFAGLIHLSGLLAPLEGTAFLDELRRLEQELFAADWADARAAHGDQATPAHLARTSTQRRADALVEMARRSARARNTPGREPVPLFTVFVGYETATERMCQTDDGTDLHPSHLDRYLGLVDIERVVFAGPSRVIDLGAKRRFYTGATRRAIQLRDRHCQHPGCDAPLHRCEIDHYKPHSAGGLTTQANGRLYCPAHNRHKGARIPDEDPDDNDDGPDDHEPDDAETIPTDPDPPPPDP